MCFFRKCWKKVELKINQNKTKLHSIGGKSSTAFKVQNNPIEDDITFSYLEAIINNNGDVIIKNLKNN